MQIKSVKVLKTGTTSDEKKTGSMKTIRYSNIKNHKVLKNEKIVTSDPQVM